MSNKLIALKDLDDLLCKYEVKDLEDLENRFKSVADLEAKLAEKEIELGNMQGMYESVTKSSTKCFKENVELREQLAESEEKYKKAYQEGLLQKKFDKDMEIDQLKQQLADSEEQIKILEENKFYSDNITQSYADKCKNYAQQLAEKEKEIEYYKSWFADDDYEKHNQDKISFCIEQLEKVKEEFNRECNCQYSKNGIDLIIDEDKFNSLIDNQIKQLKEGNLN